MPATKSAHAGSQSAVPATKSALQETSENSNPNGRTIPTMTRDRLATVVPQTLTYQLRSHRFHLKIQHFVRSLSLHNAFCVAPATKSAHGGAQSAVPATKSPHGGSQSAAPATKSAHEGSQSAAPATTSAHGGSQSAAPATKSAHGGSQSAAPATKSAHGGSQSVVPATKSAHAGSQSAVPATKSALQETSENSNPNGRTIPTMTRDRLATVVPQTLTCQLRSHRFH